MLSDDVYDAFLLVPLYVAMYTKQDLHIHGLVSKKLYKNIVNYFWRILCDFSDDLSKINFHVDGFKVADGNPNIIGTGLSCGVDSLSTVYDKYVNEDDPDYKINGLFFFNNGWHGDYRNEATKRLCLERYNMNKSAADELGLPFYLVDSNFSAFVRGLKFGVGRLGYIANYSCILGLQRGIKKYYFASCYSYDEIITFGKNKRDNDFADFSEAYSVPLLQTEKLEFVVDGCQYERTQKTEKISEWSIAQKYLNVCNRNSSNLGTASNCSQCAKCLRTLATLDILGKLKEFSGVFDLETYKKISFRYKCDTVFNRNKDAHKLDNYNLAKKRGVKLPSYFTAYMYFLPFNVYNITKKVARKILGEKNYQALRKFLRHSS